MSHKVISSLSDIDLEWLQAIIGRRHAGLTGELSGFTITGADSTTGHTARIELSYASPKDAQGPASLFVKFCRSNDQFIKDSEYHYYGRDYAGLQNSPIPDCYDTQYDAQNGAYHVLLQDLSATHYSNKEIKPDLAHALSVATALARLHAFRWGKKAEALQTDMDAVSQISAFIAQVSKGLSPVLDAIRNDVPPDWLSTLQKVFDVHPDLMKQRARSPAGQTLIHGDANPSNVLSPHDPSRKTYIIDRQPFTWSLRYWLGVSDMTYMIVPYWDTEDRQELEEPMLKKYHESLLECGVNDYSWEQCRKDYGLCILHGIYVAVGWGENADDLTGMRWLWEKQLRRSMGAFQDWKCGELLTNAAAA